MSKLGSRRLALTVLIACLTIAGGVDAAAIRIRGDFPAGAGTEAAPVCGGVPLPRGELKSADNVALFAADGKELPCQVAATAWWPDGSVKWILVDAVLSPAEANGLELRYGGDVKRSAVEGPISVQAGADSVAVSGGGVAATISRQGGVLDKCAIAGKTVVAEGAPARLVIDALRIPDGTSGEAMPINTFLCHDAGAKLSRGQVKVDQLIVESPGPIRVTILARGQVLLPDLGATLPEEVTKTEPAGSLPFSMRLSFYRNCPVIFGQHQIIYTGEPDCDYITRWGIELPGQAGPRGKCIIEPGAELDVADGRATLSAEQSRLCWAPVKAGLAIIRKGWENRPCAVTAEGGSAWIEFWPAAAGAWDLRRYAREWAVGENGDTTKPEIMLNYAKYAARGIAKSHDFVIYAGPAQGDDAPRGIVRSLSGRGLLVAAPEWYGLTEALGPMGVEETSGPLAPLDLANRRRADYHLFCQDLFNWYGKLEYGFWQSRFGQTHRNDRWDNDYGRWGWALNDGAGRIGHALMIEFLRTLDRRYFEAGEAFCRINYDTDMVHTEKHIEVPSAWWPARGNSHRHDVQPFGDPYIGMRGSNPGGQRILHLLTGDGVIADGLDIVAATSLKAGEDDLRWLCHSSDSDGQGSAANALLWKYETTRDDRYLKACRSLLDASKLIPPQSANQLGYGPSFGLFSAAGEYADLTGDQEFTKRVVALGKMGAEQKQPQEFVHAIAMAVRLSGDQKLRTRLVEILRDLAGKQGDTLVELPAEQWPGHAGYKTPDFDANLVRDYTCALGVLRRPETSGRWPTSRPAAKAIPATAPADWFRPGGKQTPQEDVTPADRLLAMQAGAGGGKLTAGDASMSFQKSLCDAVEVKGASPLAGEIAPYVHLAKVAASQPAAVSKFEVHRGTVESIGPAEGGFVAAGSAGPARFVASIRQTTADGVPSLRIEAACRIPEGGGRVASWGLLIPLRMGPDAHAIQTTAPGAFRLERCRLDQNDEQIPNWLTSEYNWGEGASLWPKWRQSGIDIGPGRFYRIWRGNRIDTSPLVCDRGRGAPAWFDVTDRGASPRWGLTVRVLQPQPADKTAARQSIRIDAETGLMRVEFHDSAAEPLTEQQAGQGLAGAADIIFHDGWRPPLAKPELTAEQYEKFLDDLDYGGNYGLFALRFCLSIDHTVTGRQWAEKVRDLGIEPRELLYSMLWRDSLAAHCKKLGVAWSPNDIEGSVRRVIEYYSK